MDQRQFFGNDMPMITQSVHEQLSLGKYFDLASFTTVLFTCCLDRAVLLVRTTISITKASNRKDIIILDG